MIKFKMRTCLILVFMITCTLSASCSDKYDTTKNGMHFKMCLTQISSILMELQDQKYLGVYDLKVDNQSLVSWDLAQYFTILRLFQYIKENSRRVEFYSNGTIKIEFYLNMWITRYLFAVEKVSKEKIEQMKATIENLKQTIDVLRNYTSQQITDTTRFRYLDGFIVLAIIATLLLFLRIKYPGKQKIINNKLKKQKQDEFWDMNTLSASKFIQVQKAIIVKTNRDILTSRLPIPKFKQCEYKFKVIKYGNNYNTIRFGLIPKNAKDTGSEKESISYFSYPQQEYGQIRNNGSVLQFKQKSNLFLKEGDYLIIWVNLISKKVVFKHEQTSQQKKHLKSVRQWSVDLSINLRNRQLFIFASLTNESIIELVSISEKS